MLTVLVKLFDRFVELVIAPSKSFEMLWILIPLILAILLTEIYFGRYKFEELGWNTAYGNSLVLLFVGMNLFKFLYTQNMLFPLTMKASLTIALTIESILLALLDFLHALPKSFTFMINSTLPLNITTYLVVILVYSDIPLDIFTFVSMLAFAFLIVLCVKFLWFLIPEISEDKDTDNGSGGKTLL